MNMIADDVWSRHWRDIGCVTARGSAQPEAEVYTPRLALYDVEIGKVSNN